jgi:hypothetical protein
MKKLILLGMLVGSAYLCHARKASQIAVEREVSSNTVAAEIAALACTSTVTTETTTRKDGSKTVVTKEVTTCDTPEELARYKKAMQ